MTIGQNFVLFVLTALFGASMRVANTPLWLWLTYKRFYAFPDAVYAEEVFVPSDVLSGADPWYAVGCLSGLLGALAIAASKIFHADTFVTVGVVLLAPLLIPLALALFESLASSMSQGPDPTARRRKRVETLTQRIATEPQPGSPLALHRHLWRAQLNLETLVAEATSAQIGKTAYQLDESALKEMEADLVCCRDHQPPDERLRHRAEATLRTLHAHESIIRKDFAKHASAKGPAGSAAKPELPPPTAADDLETLRAGLHSSSPETRERCASLLGDRGPAALAVLKDLEPLIQDPDRRVRSRAQWAVAAIGAKPRP